MLGALNYNERKVQSGDAQCIAENLFGRNVNELTFGEKKKRFDDQMRLNRKSRTNVLHVSLNFAIGERLENQVLKKIAHEYMERIGFGRQPYLVYQHFDSAHPHLHILSTSIQENGKRIPLHNIGRIQSEKARKEIEATFNLVRAEGRETVQDLLLNPKDLKKALYGKDETKRAISKIVNAVTRSYKYTSLPELNAVLQQYNVIADRGKEGTVMFAKKGLVYSLLDKKGNKVGVPIKASAIFGKPTLKRLENQFKLNEALRQPFRKGLQNKIDLTLSINPNPKLKEFINALERDKIQIVFRQNDEGRVYGITFVDNANRVVFNGSDLGKQYSAKAIMERVIGTPEKIPVSLISSDSAPSNKDTYSSTTHIQAPEATLVKPLSDLITADESYQGVDPALTRKRRKKRRRSI